CHLERREGCLGRVLLPSVGAWRAVPEQQPAHGAPGPGGQLTQGSREPRSKEEGGGESSRLLSFCRGARQGGLLSFGAAREREREAHRTSHAGKPATVSVARQGRLAPGRRVAHQSRRSS